METLFDSVQALRKTCDETSNTHNHQFDPNKYYWTQFQLLSWGAGVCIDMAQYCFTLTDITPYTLDPRRLAKYCLLFIRRTVALLREVSLTLELWDIVGLIGHTLPLIPGAYSTVGNGPTDQIGYCVDQRKPFDTFVQEFAEYLDSETQKGFIELFNDPYWPDNNFHAIPQNISRWTPNHQSYL